MAYVYISYHETRGRETPGRRMMHIPAFEDTIFPQQRLDRAHGLCKQ